MFALWRAITIIGITIAAISNGHRFANCQCGTRMIVNINTMGKVTEAAIEASEIYLDSKTTATQTAEAITAEIV